jgi:hypothetical protein
MRFFHGFVTKGIYTQELGMEKGMEKGLREGQIKIAHNLLDVLDDVAIAAATGLDQATIANLRK